MATQPNSRGVASGDNAFAQWQAAAIIAVLQRTGRLVAVKRGDEHILNGNSHAARSHEQLIEKIATNRDKDAFRALFAYFAPRLKTWLSNRGVSGDRAEDLVQDTMVAIWQKAHLYHPHKAAASTWIFQIARNKFIDQMRKQRYPEVEAEARLPELVADEETDTPLVQARISSRVVEALAQLKPSQREVVELSFYEELSHSQIAERLALPLGTVKSRIRIAFETLREALGDYQ